MCHFLPLLLLLLPSCDSGVDDSDTGATGETGTTTTETAAPVDDDEDGWPADEDCDDDDGSVHPEAEETCNGIDDDCDELVDDEDPDLVGAATYYADTDDDGFGDPETTTTACDLPGGHVDDSQDCDDTDPQVNPDATEVCNDRDDDCDDAVDDDDPDLDASTASTWYTDADGDGHGVAEEPTVACDAPALHSDVADDCDDGDSSVHPDATESCNGIDDDCDGVADSTEACPCAVEHDSSDGHPYLFCTTGQTWETAESTCRGHGYELATIDDATENSWVQTTAVSLVSTGYGWWIGYNDIDSEGTWVWSSGESPGYTQWDGGEPNDHNGEDCASVLHWDVSTYAWNDLPCDIELPYVCEAG